MTGAALAKRIEGAGGLGEGVIMRRAKTDGCYVCCRAFVPPSLSGVGLDAHTAVESS